MLRRASPDARRASRSARGRSTVRDFRARLRGAPGFSRAEPLPSDEFHAALGTCCRFRRRARPRQLALPFEGFFFRVCGRDVSSHPASPFRTTRQGSSRPRVPPRAHGRGRIEVRPGRRVERSNPERAVRGASFSRCYLPSGGGPSDTHAGEMMPRRGRTARPRTARPRRPRTRRVLGAGVRRRDRGSSFGRGHLRRLGGVPPRAGRPRHPQVHRHPRRPAQVLPRPSPAAKHADHGPGFWIRFTVQFNLFAGTVVALGDPSSSPSSTPSSARASSAASASPSDSPGSTPPRRQHPRRVGPGSDLRH